MEHQHQGQQEEHQVDLEVEDGENHVELQEEILEEQEIAHQLAHHKEILEELVLLE